MFHRSFRQLLPAAFLLMRTVSGDCAPVPAKPFTLKGEVKAAKYPAMVYLVYKDDQKLVRDSAILHDGHFLFKGSISRPLSASLILREKDGNKFGIPTRHLYLDPGVMTLESNGIFDSASITGSPSTKLEDEWNRISRPYLSQMEMLRERTWYNRANRDSTRILKEETAQALQAMEGALTVFVTQHPDSYVSWDLVDERRVAMNPATFKPSFDALSPRFRNSREGQTLADQIANVKQTEVGVRSPDFSQCDVNGSPISLRSLHGKYVMVDFWASWCGICRMENPNVLRAYNAYKDSGFTVLGVSLDDSKEKWLQAVKEDNMPWQQVCDMKGRKNDVAVLYGIIGIPQNVLLDPNGTIIAKNLRDRDLMNKLMEIFDGGHNMRVDGRIDGLRDSIMVTRYYMNDKLKADTIAIHDGHFTWLTVIPEPEKVQATLLPSGRTLQFFSDNGYLQLTGQADSLDRLQLKGSWMDEEAKAFYASIRGLTDVEKEQRMQHYIHTHPASLFSLSLVNDMISAGADYNIVNPLFISLAEVVRTIPTGRRIAEKLSSKKLSKR